MFDKIFPRIHNEGYRFIVIFTISTVVLYFINSFLGFERFQTGNTPGLTTDSIFHLKKFNNRNIKIFDTAGIKQKNKLNNTLETQSSNISIKNISNYVLESKGGEGVIRELYDILKRDRNNE